MRTSEPLLNVACDELLRIDKNSPEIVGTVTVNYAKLEKKVGMRKRVRRHRGGLSVTLEGFGNTEYFTLKKISGDQGSGLGDVCTVRCLGFNNGFELERERVMKIMGWDLTPRRPGADSYDPEGDGKATNNFVQLEDRKRLGMTYEIEAAAEGPGLVFDHCMLLIDAIHAALGKLDRDYQSTPGAMCVSPGATEICLDSILPYGLGAESFSECGDIALYPGLNIARHPDVVQALSNYFEVAKQEHYRNHPDAVAGNRGGVATNRKAGMVWMCRGVTPGVYGIKLYRKDDDKKAWTTQRSEFEVLDVAAVLEMQRKLLLCDEGAEGREKFIRLYAKLFDVAREHLHALLDPIRFEHSPGARHVKRCELLRRHLPVKWFEVQKLFVDTGSFERLSNVIGQREIRDKLIPNGLIVRDHENRFVEGPALNEALGARTGSETDSSAVPWMRFYGDPPEVPSKAPNPRPKRKAKAKVTNSKAVK